MQAVADSSTAMQAVAASSTVMQAVLASSTAMQAVAASSTAMQAVAASSTAMQAVLASSTAMQAVAASSTAMQAVAASSTAMQAVLASSTAMQAVAASSTAMEAVAMSSTAIANICKLSYNATKDVIIAINNNEDYIKKVFDTVTSDSSKFQLTVIQNQDSVSSLNQFCNTPDTIILCALGTYRAGGITSLLINNELIKSSGSGGLQPHYVDRNNCSAIAVPNATFTEYNDGHAAISVYKVI